MTKDLSSACAHLGLLHDAVLVAIDLAWSDGALTIRVRTAEGSGSVVVEGTTYLECPRA